MIEAISLGALVFTLSIRLAKLEKKCENEATVYKKCDGFDANCSEIVDFASFTSARVGQSVYFDLIRLPRR